MPICLAVEGLPIIVIMALILLGITILQKFGLATSLNDRPLTVQNCRPSDAASSVEVTLKRLSSNTLFGQESCTNVVVPGWGERLRSAASGGAEEFVATKEHEKLLASLIQSHLGGDFCLVGPKVHE